MRPPITLRPAHTRAYTVPMNTFITLANLLLATLALAQAAPAPTPQPEPAPQPDPQPAPRRAEPAGGRTWPWRCWLESPGGELPFEMQLARAGDDWRAWIINGSERIEVPTVRWEGHDLVLRFDHYDSEIRATAGGGGEKLGGTWSKRRGAEEYLKMPFHAEQVERPRFARTPFKGRPLPGKPPFVEGRWAVRFEKSEEPAVGVFAEFPGGVVHGTFLTPTGDYRYLAGLSEPQRLRLSCFDGAHAFLFDAKRQEDGTLKGDFWSGAAWHDTWTARRADSAALPDEFSLTRWNEAVKLDALSFPDLAGQPRSLADPEFAGKARIIYVFGSWCPNCHDATEFLVELHQTYRDRGLSILGLAFELTGDSARDTQQVRKYIAHHGVEYPVLLAGVADKSKATAALPLLDQLRAYPTTIFLDETGAVRAVFTGFSGPATGESHARLRQRWTEKIEELLGTPAAKP